jgi:hypothetical protein
VPSAPLVLALSTYSAPLGRPVDVFLQGLPPPSEGTVSLRFVGTYRRTDGTIEPVDTIAPTNLIDGNTLRWTTFGPFNNPFDSASSDPLPGIFEGKIAARVLKPDGTLAEDPAVALQVVFQVQPSILIEDFEPTSASCGGPAKRAFAGFHYGVKAKAMGFVPTQFVYTLQTPAVVMDTTNPDPSQAAQFQTQSDGSLAYAQVQVVHDAMGASDAVAGDEAFLLPRLPANATDYNLLLVIQAYGAGGNAVTTEFVMVTQNPISMYYDGRYQLAQLYPPEPMSNCIPGGTNGRTVGYSDTNTETEQRSLTVTLSQSWLNSVSHSETGTVQNTWTTQDGNTYQQSTTDTSGWGSSSSTGITNTQGAGTSTDNANSSGTNSSNAFNTSVNGAKSKQTTDTLGWQDEYDQSQGSSQATSNTVGGSLSLGSSETFVSGGGNGSHQGTSTQSSSSTSSGMNSGSNANSTSSTGGWSNGYTGTTGGTTNTSNSNGTSTSASFSTSSLDQQSVSGSTASTDSTSATHVDTLGGGTSQQTTDGSQAQQGQQNSSADAWTVSSAEAIGQSFSGVVVAGTFGAFYRQRARYEREAFVLVYDKCGDAQVIGELTLEDPTWAVDMAQSPVCPPMPATNFPPAQCLAPPCDP